MRKYYKYTEESYTRPLITSNGIPGLDHFACFSSGYNATFDMQPFRAFEEEIYASRGFRQSWGDYNGQYRPAWLAWYVPYKHKMTSLTIENSGSDSHAYFIRAGEIQWSDDGFNWNLEQSFTSDNAVYYGTWDINIENPVYSKYKRIYITASTVYGMIEDIQFNNCTVLVPHESTSANYDFYLDTPRLRVKPCRKYYKYGSKSWSRPNISANGTLGGANFAVQSSSWYDSNYMAWKAVNGTNSSAYDCWLSNAATADYIFYNPTPLNVTKLTILNRNGSNLGITSGNVYGSNDNVNWTLLKGFTNSNIASNSSWDIDLANNTAFYKYYKIECLTKTTYYTIAELGITATEQTIVEGTSSNYDFYEDGQVFYGNKTGTRRYYKYASPISKSLPTYSSTEEMWNGKDGVSIGYLEGNFSYYADFYKTVGQTSSSIVPRYSKIAVQYDGLFKLEQVNFNTYVVANSVPDAALTQVSGVGDGVETVLWTGTMNRNNPTVQITNNNYYDTYYVYFSCGEPNIYGGGGVTYFNLSGQYKQKVEADATNYDFYEDAFACRVLKY